LVHKFQFEKEFNIYNELWGLLIKLRNSAASLRPSADFMPHGKTREEIKKDRLDLFDTSFNEVVKSFDYNKPFYSIEIYKEIEKILRISRSEAIDYSFGEQKGKEYWEQGEKNINTIVDSVDVILNLIRKRIDFVEVQ
jgi:hypothetical protein